MRAFAIVLTLLALVGGAGGCRRADKCLPTCEQRASELHCGRAYECKEECEDLSKRKVCRAELDTFAACFLKQPKEQWECDEHGKPVPKQSVCGSERSAVATCMERAFTSPNPPKSL